jgi:hypothetical protein
MPDAEGEMRLELRCASASWDRASRPNVVRGTVCEGRGRAILVLPLSSVLLLNISNPKRSVGSSVRTVSGGNEACELRTSAPRAICRAQVTCRAPVTGRPRDHFIVGSSTGSARPAFLGRRWFGTCGDLGKSFWLEDDVHRRRRVATGCSDSCSSISERGRRFERQDGERRERVFARAPERRAKRRRPSIERGARPTARSAGPARRRGWGAG